jgi:hypothetical protein
MDASPYLRPASPGLENLAVGRLVNVHRIRAGHAPRLYVSEGWPAFFEYEIPANVAEIDKPLLYLSTGQTCGPLEFWWSDGAGGWSELRSVRLWLREAHGNGHWMVPLDRLPHWRLADARLIRIYIRSPGPFEMGVPRLLRLPGQSTIERVTSVPASSSDSGEAPFYGRTE